MTYVPALPPYSHQADFLATRVHEPAFGLLWEQGTGKTKSIIDNACQLFEEGHIQGVVVLASNGVHRNWLTDELPTHLPERLRGVFRAEAWSTAKSGTKKHKWAMEDLVKPGGFPWLLMSYDAIMTDAGNTTLRRMLQSRPCMIAGDEAHNIKAPGAKRTIRALAVAKRARYRRIATGTPVSQGPFDIYSQIKFLDETFWERRGFPNFHVFKRHFGVWLLASEVKAQSGYDPGYDQLVEYRNLDELHGYLQEISNRVLKKDVLDLPEKVYTRRYYKLTTEQRRLMDELKKDFVATLGEGKRVTAQLAITRILRAQQICCGYVPIDTDDEHAELHMLEGGNPRLDAFVEEAEETHTQGIVWARFSKDIDLIIDALGGPTQAARFDGRVTEDEGERAKAAFKAGDVKWFVANPAKGKEGITLVQGKRAIYYNNTFRLLDRLQSEDRMHRIGQRDSVLYTDLIAEESRVDEHVVRSLRNKLDVASQITGDELMEWI
jgi:SNF2 family DNA or RNA helicase